MCLCAFYLLLGPVREIVHGHDKRVHTLQLCRTSHSCSTKDQVFKFQRKTGRQNFCDKGKYHIAGLCRFSEFVVNCKMTAKFISFLYLKNILTFSISHSLKTCQASSEVGKAHTRQVP